MTFTRFVIIYCVTAAVLLLSLLAGIATSSILSRISTLEDRVETLEFENKKLKILSEDKTSDDKFVVIIPEKLTQDTETTEAASESVAEEVSSVESSPMLDIQDELK